MTYAFHLNCLRHSPGMFPHYFSSDYATQLQLTSSLVPHPHTHTPYDSIVLAYATMPLGDSFPTLSSGGLLKHITNKLPWDRTLGGISSVPSCF